jgi:hypothetical protein
MALSRLSITGDTASTVASIRRGCVLWGSKAGRAKAGSLYIESQMIDKYYISHYFMYRIYISHYLCTEFTFRITLFTFLRAENPLAWGYLPSRLRFPSWRSMDSIVSYVTCQAAHYYYYWAHDSNKNRPVMADAKIGPTLPSFATPHTHMHKLPCFSAYHWERKAQPCTSSISLLQTLTPVVFHCRLHTIPKSLPFATLPLLSPLWVCLAVTESDSKMPCLN